MVMQLSKRCLQKLKQCNKYHGNTVLPNKKTSICRLYKAIWWRAVNCYSKKGQPSKRARVKGC